VALALVGAMTAVLAPVRERLGQVNVVLLFLLLVLIAAARWGWGPGIFASLAANLAYNFFFVSPVHTFTVQEPHNAVTLPVFLLVAALTSALLGRARVGEAAARRREQETAVLYDLSRVIIVTPDARSALTAVCERARETFAVDGCVVLAPQDGRLATVAASSSTERTTTDYERHAAEEAFATGEIVFVGGRGPRRPRIVGMADRRAPVVYVPLRVGGQTVGALEVVGTLRARVFTADELRLLAAFADIAALALDRDRLLRQAAGAEALRETDRLKSALLSAVSHDLRTPLASIKSAVSGLLDPDVMWDEATRRELLTAVDEETDRLTRFVANLLDLSRIEGGALRPDTDWYDVRELLETATARLGRMAARHRLTLHIDEEIGEAPLDYVQISQVIANLVENAAKFAPEGTEIRVAARRLPDAVELSVADQGPGIPPEERDHVFEKFYRAPGAGRRAHGAGLGLAICKGLVEAHGGRIRAEDAPGGGARFVVMLPAPARSIGRRRDRPTPSVSTR
jgi:two-component system sensor histidine kinase KdpD